MPYADEEPPLFEPDAELDALARGVIGAAIEVHRQLCAGLDEAMYEAAMCIEMRHRGIPFDRQVSISVQYKGEFIGKRQIDLLVGGRLIVELKAVDQLGAIHTAQVITYLKITGLQLALIINFKTAILRDGIKRIIRS